MLKLLDVEPDLAPRAAAFELAESLARLIDEMHEEGVGPEAMLAQDVGALSGHWQRSLRVLGLVTRYFGADAPADETAAARLDRQVRRLIADWETAPPEAPVLVAGSTGSRGTTFRLMQAVARLPQGALVLPGYDSGQPEAVWAAALDGPHRGPSAVPLRPAARGAGTGARRSAALGGRAGRNTARGADVAGAAAGAGLGPMGGRRAASGRSRPATGGLTLIEAPDAHLEALAIATAAREAVHRGQVVAIVTPDRALTRRWRRSWTAGRSPPTTAPASRWHRPPRGGCCAMSPG